MKANKQKRLVAVAAAVVSVSAMSLFVSGLGNDSKVSDGTDAIDYVSETYVSSEDIEGATMGIFSISKVGTNLVGSAPFSVTGETEASTEEETTDETADEKESVSKIEQASLMVTEVMLAHGKEAIPYKYDDTFIVNVSDYVNIRKEASAESELVGKIFKGGGGTILEKGAEWSKIKSGNVEGYINNQYAYFEEDVEVHINEFCSRYGVSSADALRVRKGPSTNDEVIAVVNTGTEIQVLAVEGDWAKVNYIGKEAYIYAGYLEIEYFIEIGMTVEEEQEAIRLEQERLEAERKAKEEAEALRKQKLENAIANSQLTETVQTSAYNVSEEDAYLLACLVCAEAGYESYEGKLAVANVVLNRLKGGRYGNTIYDVTYARGQFSVVTNGALNRVINNGPNADSIKAAKEALSGVNNVPEYANFCSLSAANYDRYEKYTIICNQVFYRRK